MEQSLYLCACGSKDEDFEGHPLKLTMFHKDVHFHSELSTSHLHAKSLDSLVLMRPATWDFENYPSL